MHVCVQSLVSVVGACVCTVSGECHGCMCVQSLVSTMGACVQTSMVGFVDV